MAAENGAQVTLLEAETVGHGGSGRNVGLVNAGLWLPPDAVCAKLGPHAGERLNSVLATAPDRVFDLIDRHGIACEPVRAGTLNLAHSSRGLQDLENRRSQLAARGAPVRLLSAEETRARTGTNRFHGALFDPRAGTIQPLAYARGLARAARSAGASVHERSPVISASFENGAWRLMTDHGCLSAGALLVATNAYHTGLADISTPAMPVVQFFQLATEPAGDNRVGEILAGGEGCWDTGMVMTSLRRDRAGRIILGGMGSAAEVHGNWARRTLRRFFPQSAGLAVEHAWTGRIALTYDKLPRILRIGPRGFAVFGYSGRGIAPGTVFGRAVARSLLTGTEAGLPVAPVDSHHEAFVPAKSAVYELGARLMHMYRGHW